ncbi:MAG: enoyl-CoA hydratase/isomerase family protein [Gammaproteobacteria bacterium]|nr:enoyl-CoA hydratase/isomerase family protein [Gammaproteobacteria bacterium]
MTQAILFETIPDANNNRLGKITLNRPQALNALNGDMFLHLEEQLKAWAKDDSIKAVLIRSNCEKAFSAGGDLRAIYDARAQPASVISAYFCAEYDINRIIFHYPKPYIALTQGITMGGGVGISLHGSHCVAAPNLRWAMPETMIGFFPDVGTSYYLSRLPDFYGIYLALTGHVITAAEAFQIQLTHHVIPTEKFDAVEKKLIESCFHSYDAKTVTDILAEFSDMIGNTALPNAEEIKICFCYETIEEIMGALKKQDSPWSHATLAKLQKASPTSLKVTLKHLWQSRNQSFDETISVDFCIARTMLSHHDFFEGIRATIIDKDKTPHWEPALFSDVHEVDIQPYFST